jgi:hypothetical protein
MSTRSLEIRIRSKKGHHLCDLIVLKRRGEDTRENRLAKKRELVPFMAFSNFKRATCQLGETIGFTWRGVKFVEFHRQFPAITT